MAKPPVTLKARYNNVGNAIRVAVHLLGTVVGLLFFDPVWSYILAGALTWALTWAIPGLIELTTFRPSVLLWFRKLEKEPFPLPVTWFWWSERK